MAPLEHPPPRHRRPRFTLYRYLASEALAPTAFALIGLTVVVLTTRILGYSELVVNRGVGGGDVVTMIAFEAVPVAARMFPFAVLVGLLVALGRLGADREILVLEASGVAAARLVWPAVSFAGAMTVLVLVLSLWATPWASRSFDAALEQISRARPWAQLQAGVVNEFGGWQLEAREVSPSGKELKGVLLWVPDVGETIFARAARLGATDRGAIEITLIDGSVVLPPDGEDLRQLRFRQATTVLPESDVGLVRNEFARIPGLPLQELIDRALVWQPSEGDRLPRAALALHRRFADPAATLIFGFLAVPLFVARRNYSRSGGGVIGLACTIAYYGLVQISEGLVQAGSVGVALGAWLPNLVLASLALVLLLRALRERVAGQRFEGPRARAWLRRLSRRSASPDVPRSRPHRYALARYVAGRFLQLVALSFSVLFVAYFLIDVMDRVSWFSKHEATPVEVVRFYGARIWLLVSRAVPMAILVATALTVSLLAVEGELIGMRACGIPAPRALLPVLLLAALIAPLYFLLNNVVVPRTNALADELKDTEIKDGRSRLEREAQKAGYWYRFGNHLLEAVLFDPDRGQARELTIFDLGEDGLPIGRTDATRALHVGGGRWRLRDPSRVEVANGGLARVPAPRYAQLGEDFDARVDTMHLPVDAIAAEARAVEADGFDATHFWVDYHARLAEPLACVVLPAVVLFFAVTGPPFPSPAQTLLVSGILGVSYILLVALGSSFGRGGAVPPVVGAWGPIGLFGVVASYLLARLWGRL